MTGAALLAILMGAIGMPPPFAPLAPAARVERAYAGVACRTPNAIACDRIGIAVDVRPAPLRASAFVGLRRVRLAPYGSGGLLAGYLPRAGLAPLLREHGATLRGGRWLGDAAPRLGAVVVATYADGRRERLPVLTPLRPGWG